ncbi:response regulator transcription factor [Streptomyces sp. NPDC051582]|uniref:response regulator transcription factor n=1 Tax=Streptomyces sp. NPDC051582 TaxID=3155167 RepID=UPI0034174439
MIRVAVVDDEPLVRTGLQVILESAEDINVVLACGGAGAVASIRSHDVDVLLLDIRMPVVDGMSVLRHVVGAAAAPAVAMLTSFGLEEHVDEALRAGAAGFLMKNSSPEQLVAAVRTLAAGGRVLAPEATGPVISGYLAAEPDSEAARRVGLLSERELQVLAELGTGRSNRDIADRLHLAHGTVKDHVSSILAKLGGLNRVQAAVVADRARLLRPRRAGS